MLLTPRVRSFSTDASLLLGAAFLLCWIAVYNGYPLVYSDTGSYIHSGFENTVPLDRPIVYGLFVRHISLKFSLWLVIFMQSLLTAACIRFFISAVITETRRQRMVFSAAIGVLALGTGLSQKCSNLLPDFLTALVALVITVWLVRPPEKKSARWLSLIMLIFALTAHASHLYILAAALLLFTVLRVFRKSVFRSVPLRRLRNVYLFLFVGVGSAALINLAFTGKFFISRNAQVFMTGHLADSGLLDEFLNEQCGTKKYVLCPWAGALKGVDFLWDEQSSPLYKTGGWEHSQPAYSEMLGDFFSDPRYLGKFIGSSLKISAKQLVMIDVDAKEENAPMGVGSAPYGQVVWRFKKEAPSYLAARQAMGTLSYTWINVLQYITVIASLLVFGWVIFQRALREKMPLLITALSFVFCFLIANAAICGTFTIAHTRFGSRVIWLLPLIAIVMVAELIRLRKAGKNPE